MKLLMEKCKNSGSRPVWRRITTCAGEIPVAYTEEGLYALQLPEEASACSCLEVGSSDPAWLQKLAFDLQAYFNGEEVSFTAPVDYSGYPPFYRRALSAAAKIPYGKTVSYGALARAAGSPRAARAVGQAMAHNRTPVVIPCHRVLASDMSLGGFGGGLDLKKKLLNLEGLRGRYRE
jgi:methylated-DNA-[protein]-cysteine S-methyltransferase